MEKFIKRINNPKVLTSIVSAILLVAVNAGFIDVAMSAEIEIAVNAVLSALIGLGVFGNPESHIKE